MWKVDIPIDTKEAVAIARRKTAEDARMKRIFNPKQRMIGKDYEALQLQVQERRARDQEERQRRDVYNQEINRQDIVAFELERRINANKKLVAKDIEVFRQTQQRFEDRREFDLNDPELLKKTLPARLDDHDLRCGIASVQRFEGEDINGKERYATQVMQNRLALEAQLRDKKTQDDCKKKAMELYAQNLQEMDLRTCCLWGAELEARRAVRNATSQYNMAMACENKEKQALEKRAEQEAAMAHVMNMCNSELLTECADACTVLGPHRVCRDRHKGFSKDKMLMIHEEQQRQIMAKKQQDLTQRQEDAAWDNLKRRESLAGLLIDFDLDKQRREIRAQTERTNMELAREQALRQEYLNRILYRDHPTEEFYEQFNTTTR